MLQARHWPNWFELKTSRLLALYHNHLTTQNLKPSRTIPPVQNGRIQGVKSAPPRFRHLPSIAPDGLHNAAAATGFQRLRAAARKSSIIKDAADTAVCARGCWVMWGEPGTLRCLQRQLATAPPCQRIKDAIALLYVQSKPGYARVAKNRFP